MTPFLIAQIGLTLFVFVMLLNSAAIMVYVERKVAAMLQQRLGPYLVGPKGLLQPLHGEHEAKRAPIIQTQSNIEHDGCDDTQGQINRQNNSQSSIRRVFKPHRATQGKCRY